MITPFVTPAPQEHAKMQGLAPKPTLDGNRFANE